MAYRNKEDQAKAAHKHYLKNKDKMKKRAVKFKTAARERNRKFSDDYKRKHPCVDCGEDDIVVLQFDHVNGDKDKEVSIMINKAYSLERIQREIDKCEIRCANCHLRRHHSLRQ